MNINKYVGHESQISGVEESRLVGGKGDGMRLLRVRNGKGLDFTISADRCFDISRLSTDGVNFGYFAACGYVAPAYYDGVGTGFLKGFYAGFLTTCGLANIGAPCIDDGEILPQHGTISYIPAEHISYTNDDKEIIIRAEMFDASIFGRKLRLIRQYSVSKEENALTIKDIVRNESDKPSPLLIMYHMNMGYPLLSENAKIQIPSDKVRPRDPRAAEDTDSWNVFLPPTAGFEEQVYYHDFNTERIGKAGIFNSDVEKGLIIHFDTKTLDHFIQWKMPGQSDYVLGLEPTNGHAGGRDKVRADGELKFIQPEEEIPFTVHLKMTNNEAEFDAEFA